MSQETNAQALFNLLSFATAMKRLDEEMPGNNLSAAWHSSLNQQQQRVLADFEEAVQNAAEYIMRPRRVTAPARKVH